MAMRPRGGAQVPRSQFVVRPTYDDFVPKFDEKEEQTSYILNVYLPGFTREQLKVTYDESTKKIKAHGERPLGNYRWSRFEKEFSIPQNCIGSQIRGKFERNVLMITIQKKPTSQVVAPQQSPAPPPPKKAEEAIPPKATSSIQKQKEDKPDGPSSPKRAIAEPIPQKGKQDPPQKPTSAGDLGEKERGKKTVEPASPPKAISPKKVTSEPKPEKGKQDSPQKPTSAGDLGEKETGKKPVEPAGPPKAISPKKVTAEPKPQKGNQDSPQKHTPAADKRAMESIGHPEATTQTKPQKVQNQSPPKQTHESVTQKTPKEKDRGKKSKEAAIAESDLSKKKMEQEKHEMSGAKKTNEVQHVAAYAKEVIGKLAKRIKEDEESKKSLINAGVAAMVIVAMGTYIAYTIGSGDTSN